MTELIAIEVCFLTMNKYVIGIDYGSESGRVVVVDVADGAEVGSHITRYEHGVMDEVLLPAGIPLDSDWALQQPMDYLKVLTESVPKAIQGAGIQPEQVIGIGIDFTSCTVLPVDGDLVPLCWNEAYKHEPHAYVKLWKHHAAQDEADTINRTAQTMGLDFMKRYGAKTSSEWIVAKALQILNESPHIYDSAVQFVEAADWIVSQLTGKLARSSCCAGYKAFWDKKNGYPPSSFFAALDDRMEDFIATKLRGEVYPLDAKAGELSERAAEITGLPSGIAVAVGVIDAHAGVPGAGAYEPGQLVMSMGTSLCHMLLSDKEQYIEGVCGVVEDGIIPGLFAYESGQPAVGDMFAWYVDNAVPHRIYKEAEAAGISVHAMLEKLASGILPGQSGLIALDWWNGNRSVLANSNLSGIILGMTLNTKPEEMYRALLESAAFGTRKIIETYEKAGISVNEILACGGLPKRNKLLMQIYADVLGREIKVASSDEAAALGAAMYAAVAAGRVAGGYDRMEDAVRSMARFDKVTYIPTQTHSRIYNELYVRYLELHDLFGRKQPQLMQSLRKQEYRL
ncbi:MAG: ribulokinase [Paenibacillus sp.]|jgi:L-ribulokinase|nr:ribulokinase [Paenibacillus sp.]